MSFENLFSSQPHRRFNPLTGEWVLVSPHRANRPWLGQMDRPAQPRVASYDPSCYLCPGNERAAGYRNPPYESTFVFDNDFAALLPDSPPSRLNDGGLLVAESERGICRVMCFSPHHAFGFPLLSEEEVACIVRTWTEQYVSLGSVPWINSVQIFENRGEMMGCSNPHPHCQIWANETVPSELAKETARQQDYFTARGKCLLCDYSSIEQSRERVVLENDSFLTVVPFWAVWPFETLVVSKRHYASMDQMAYAEQAQLASMLKRLTTCYDALFETPFPYSMGFHQRPTDGHEHPSFHFHGHFYPPLLRSAEVRKFMVGYEMLACPQRDLTPESAAARLRDLVG